MQQDNVAAFVYYILYRVVRLFIFLVYVSEEGCLYGKFGSRHEGTRCRESHTSGVWLQTCSRKVVYTEPSTTVSSSGG